MIHLARPQSRPAVIVAGFWNFVPDGRTDNMCENSDHYRPELWSASWIKIHDKLVFEIKYNIFLEKVFKYKIHLSHTCIQNTTQVWALTRNFILVSGCYCGKWHGWAEHWCFFGKERAYSSKWGENDWDAEWLHLLHTSRGSSCWDD